MKYYIIAGERSGDLHASNLVGELKKKDASASFRAWGGEMLEEEGVELFQHYKALSFMGFLEALIHIFAVFKYLKTCKNDIFIYQPDVLILVDFAGFNLRIAKWAKANGIKVYYYISPKVWAWNQKRAYKIKERVNRMFCILPFEKEFYKKFDFEVDYVGNPVLDSIRNFDANPNFIQENNLGDKPIIAILPGSRKNEVERALSFMLSLISAYPDYQFVVAGVKNLEQSFYANFRNRTGIKVIYEQTYDLLSHAHAAMVTSGTATLEAALFEVPQVVVYRTSMTSYLIGRVIVKVKFISLVNLIAKRKIVTELIQENFSPMILKKELDSILTEEGRNKMLKGYKEVKEILGDTNASERTAELMLKYLN